MSELFTVLSLGRESRLVCPTQQRKQEQLLVDLEQAIAQLDNPRGLCAEYCGPTTECTFRLCHECESEMPLEDILGTLGDSTPQCSSCGNSHYYEDRDDDRYGDFVDGVGVSDPGSDSLLRAETGGNQGYCPACRCEVAVTNRWCACCGQKLNPRIFPCGSCDTPGVLTEADVLAGYCCNVCASRNDGTYRGGDY